MASSIPFFLPSLFILLLVFSTVTKASATSSVVAKDIVPCTMCAECENPCQPPPPPPVVECPPPPAPPPPSPPLPPAIVECPPPPKPPCPDNCESPPQSYFPPGTPFTYYVPPDYDSSGGGKMMPLLFSNQCLISATFFYLPLLLGAACLI